MKIEAKVERRGMTGVEVEMVTTKQTHAARRNIRKATAAATKKRTIAHMPSRTRHALETQAARRSIRKATAAATKKRTIAHMPSRTRHALALQAAAGRRRGGRAGHRLEDRNREQIYELAKAKEIRGRSTMGKWELIEAIRRAR